MAATIEIQTDAGVPITSFNWGAIGDGDDAEYKFKAKNIGDQDASSVLIFVERLVQNDGVDFASIAEDVGGNPGTYAPTPLNIGSLPAGDEVFFWVDVTVPTGTTPAGNPRQFKTKATWRGT